MYFSDLLLALCILTIVIVVAFLTFLKAKNINPIDWFKDEKNKGAYQSAGLGVGVVIVISGLLALIPNNANAAGETDMNATWFNDAGVYLGLDYTRGQSPQCKEGGSDERGTSNLGVKGNIWQSASKNIRVNAKYTHHSCFIGSDQNSYDGLGVELEWTVFRRKK